MYDFNRSDLDESENVRGEE
ncbi:hypothetical protein LHV34_06675 [Lactococcus lactis]|nr:hypothetical protein [Lactococcus lactis]